MGHTETARYLSPVDAVAASLPDVAGEYESVAALLEAVGAFDDQMDNPERVTDRPHVYQRFEDRESAAPIRSEVYPVLAGAGGVRGVGALYLVREVELGRRGVFVQKLADLAFEVDGSAPAIAGALSPRDETHRWATVCTVTPTGVALARSGHEVAASDGPPGQVVVFDFGPGSGLLWTLATGDTDPAAGVGLVGSRWR